MISNLDKLICLLVNVVQCTSALALFEMIDYKILVLDPRLVHYEISSYQLSRHPRSNLIFLIFHKIIGLLLWEIAVYSGVQRIKQNLKQHVSDYVG